MKHVLFGIVLAVVATAPALAAPSADAAKRTIEAYAAAAARGPTCPDLKKHWSVRFAKENEAMYAQQVAPLPAATRATIEKSLCRGVAEIAHGSLRNMSVTCTASGCTARAKLPGNVTQVYSLIEERGVMVIDKSEMTAGP